MRLNEHEQSVLLRLSYGLTPQRDSREFQPVATGVISFAQLREEVAHHLNYKDLRRLISAGLIRDVRLLPIETDAGVAPSRVIHGSGRVFYEVRESPWYFGLTLAGRQFLHGDQPEIVEEPPEGKNEQFNPFDAQQLWG